MLNEADFSFEKCFIVKGNGFFAHGKTIKDAMKDLEEKIYDDMDVEDKIEQFKKKFKKDKKYKGTEFYSWHHILTGSCVAGRDNFVKKHQLNLDEFYTVNQFIELCESDYGGNIIRELKKHYK